MNILLQNILDHNSKNSINWLVVYQMFNAMNLVYYKDKICRIWIGLKPIVILFTPAEVEVSLNNNSDFYLLDELKCNSIN